MFTTVLVAAARCVTAVRHLHAGMRGQIAAFRSDRSGNVALIFGIAIIPLVGVVAVAVDYSRANAARTVMQAALDATTLMVSKDSYDLQSTQVQTKARAYFSALFNRPDVKNVNVTFARKANGPGDFTVVAEGTGALDTMMAQVIGYKSMAIRTTAQVRWGFKSVELALALDNTGSMAAKNKMVELKAAVKLLLATLKKNSKTPDDTKIAIVPFNTVVKVGTAYVNAPWVEYDSTITKSNWAGCVADRDQPNDVKDTVPSGSTATMFPVADCAALAQTIPLTNNWDALEGMVDTMTPGGTTNVTIGLMWAWHALTQGEPLTQGTAVRPDVEKVIVLLTDGLNTQNRFTTVPSQIDARTAAVCANLKTTNIRVFTVRVIEGNVSLLQGCASTPTMFYDVQVASQLKDVFAAIAASLSGARLSK